MNGIQDCQKSESAQNVNQPIGTERRCKKCGENKSLSSFVKDKRTKGIRKGVVAGFTSVCKQCEYKRVRIWWLKNPKKSQAYSKRWRLLHAERSKDLANKSAKKRLFSPKIRIGKSLSSGIWYSLKRVNKRKNGHWENLVGYTIEQLKKHLEKQFKDGMSWDNYGKKGWWIDHIVPITAFNFEKPEDDDFKRCWGLSNLRPMWYRENIIKNNKLEKPFQPKLIFAKTGLQR